MNKAHENINWENYPSDKTAVNEYNLNKMDRSIDVVDNRVIFLDNTKATKVEMSTLFKEVSYDERTGIITFTRKNGATVTIDTPMEKIQTGIYYNPDTEKLVLPLIDGTSMEVDLSRLMQFDEFIDSDTIAFSVKANGTVTAIVKEGSIEEKHLRPDYLADIRIETAKAQLSENAAARSREDAESYANLSKSYAIGTQNEMRPNDEKDNAKEYAKRAEEAAVAAENIIAENFVLQSEKGKPGGVASLSENGKVPEDQLPDTYTSISWSAVANNDTTTSEGYVLDARVAKMHRDEINSIHNSVVDLEKKLHCLFVEQKVVAPQHLVISANDTGGIRIYPPVIDGYHPMDARLETTGHRMANCIGITSGEDFESIYFYITFYNMSSGEIQTRPIINVIYVRNIAVI